MPERKSNAATGGELPDDITISNCPARIRLSNDHKSCGFRGFFLISNVRISSTRLVTCSNDRERGSSRSEIRALGHTALMEARVGRKRISSPMPPKFIVKIFIGYPAVLYCSITD